MSEEADQQITEKYVFIITPIEIKSNSKIKSSNRKSILIKLSNKTAKCTELNTPLELQIDVLYSKTLQKYCPIKGIIKIYDVSEDGSEIISCVGGFQTDQLLNQGKNYHLLQKEIGTSKLKMQITIVNKNQKKTITQATKLNTKSQEITSVRQRSLNKSKQLQKSNSTSSITKTPKGPVNNSLGHNGSIPSKKSTINTTSAESNSTKPLEIPFKNTSNSINKSLQKISQALNYKRFQESNISAKANQVLVKAQVQTFKQQLADEKRKATLYQDRFFKSNQKLTNYKTYLAHYHNELKAYHQAFKKLLTAFQLNNMSPITQIDQATQKYCIKYKSKQVDQIFKDFIALICIKSLEELPNVQLQLQSLQSSRSLHELQQSKKELAILKKLATQKDKKIFSLQKQLQGVEVTIKNLKQTNKNLSEENRYLRTRNNQIQENLYHKQASLQSLLRQIEKMRDSIMQEERKYNNSCLQIQQLKQEIFNCTETIERYREKYGDLKNVKNRAIQMQIKECLRWIDLQNRDMQMSDIHDTAHSEHSQDYSLSSVIRNIEIEKVSKEQMTVIRDQLVRILEKVDSLMSK